MIRTLLWVWTLWVVVALYVGEAAMGLIFEKSIALSPVPPHAIQHHTTSDYAVTYRYNNIGLRGPDFDPNVAYDALLIGDSFIFGTGVEQDQTITGLLTASGLRVFVAAEPATNPPQYLQKSKVLAAWGLKSRALVVGLFVGNDFQGLAGKDISELLLASLTLAVKLKVPVAEGVPASDPVLVSDMPDGNWPAASDQPYGVVPPVAFRP